MATFSDWLAAVDLDANKAVDFYVEFLKAELYVLVFEDSRASERFEPVIMSSEGSSFLLCFESEAALTKWRTVNASGAQVDEDIGSLKLPGFGLIKNLNFDENLHVVLGCDSGREKVLDPDELLLVRNILERDC